MRLLEEKSQRLVVRSGSRLNPTTCVFDKSRGTARIVRQVLFWQRPLERPLSDVDDASVREIEDPASGTCLHIPVVHFSSGEVVAISGKHEENAREVTDEIREFLRLGSNRH